jgi:hypothetical protein
MYMLRPNPEFVQFQNWMAIPNRNLHVGLLYSLAVDFCRLYQSLGLPNWQNIYLDIHVTSQTRIGPIGDLDGLRDHPKHPNIEIPFWDGDPITEIPDLDKFRNGT